MTSIFKWKTTLIFKMEDNFNFLNERRPQFFFNGRWPQFCLIENDLNVSMNWRWHEKKIMQPNTIKIKKRVVAPLLVTYFLVLSDFFHSVWEKCGHTMFFSVKFLPMQFEMLKVLKLKNWLKNNYEGSLGWKTFYVLAENF